MTIHKWMVQIEDENGDTKYLTEEPIIGTWHEISHFAENLADEWEAKTGGLCLKLKIESRGNV